MNKTLTATLIAALAAPAMAGGPVILEEPEVVAERPASNILVPILVLVAVGVLLSGRGGDEEAVAPCIPNSAEC